MPEFQSPSTACGPVLVFDSGVGGLSVVQAIRERLPDLPLVYAFDNAGFPYGTRSDAWLLQHLPPLIEHLLQAINPGLLVIACNTASTVALPALRERFTLPIIGVVPAIKPAALMTRTGHIGLLATQATIQRPYTQELIQRFAADCTVTQVGSNELVQLAEQQLAGQPPARAALLSILQPFIAEPRLDTLVLGCTHFPLLQAQLAEAAASAGIHPWQWIDSGAAIARRVQSLLQEQQLQPAALDTTLPHCWITAPLPENSRLPDMLQRLKLLPLQLL